MWHTRVLLGIALSLCACAPNPKTHRQQLIMVSDEQMTKLGSEAYAKVLNESQLSTQTALMSEVELVGRRIAQASGKSYDWQFNLIEDPMTVNAFCLPGGKIAVYTGMIPLAQNTAGLAAVLGHEVAHAVLRHGAERVSQTMLAQMALTLAELSINGKYQQLIAGLLGMGVKFGVLLPYSRKHEAEADAIGLEYMAKAGYEPMEAVRLWQRMAAKEADHIPEILKTHPDSKRRALELERLIDKANELYAGSEQQPTQTF